MTSSYQMAYGQRERIWMEERHICKKAKGISCRISSTSDRDQEELIGMGKAKQPQITNLGLFCWEEVSFKAEMNTIITFRKGKATQFYQYVRMKQQAK